MYVAITRAKQRLYLTRSKSRYLYGHRDLTRPSKFIGELAAELGVREERISYRSYEERGYGGYNRGYRADGERSAGRALYSDSDDYSTSPSFAQKSSFKAFYGGNNQRQPTQKAAGNSSSKCKYTVGMRVKHPKFGTGMVVSVKNGGTVINVAFEGQGVKELSASIAPLTII